MLEGSMMNQPLLLTHFLERARDQFSTTEVLWLAPDKSVKRYTWGDVYARSARLANALTRLGVRAGDRVATLCWNHGPHLEAYLGVPAMGAVLHTLNLRLHPSELAYIARHAEDQVLIVDHSLLPLVHKFRAEVPSIQQGHRGAGHRPRRRRPRLRAAAGGGARPLRLAAPRRERGGDDLLHLGHHRPPQGRRLQPSLDGAAHAGLLHARHLRPERRGHAAGGGADVPRLRVGAAVLRRRHRRQADLSRAAPSIRCRSST